ncbi:potassium/proton antiporter [Thermanaeromonas sp. C210]|uniref:potassium/proton antiporter n=1 Tax=Thermanaeromonas sp. C210 TaxID=2731925 RepID=UPI00155D1235|nr:potassium/proton antiporter [Thermanaeromonas sp. C210]GFN22005.1 potassium/proton antiporter [Thermanaeromonas sp. C210]
MILLLSILLLLATFSTKLTLRVGVPGLVIFLGLGMLFGSDGLNLIYFDDPLLAQRIANIALIIILFEGGFATKKEVLQSAFAPSFALATVGVLFTAVALGLATHYIVGLSLEASFLVGAIVSSTDAAAVFSIFRNKSIRPKLATTLEAESASNDPMAIILTISMLDYIQNADFQVFAFIAHLIWQIVGGLGMGYLFGRLGPHLFNRARLESGGFYYVLVLGFCYLSFGVAEAIGANGFLAVFIAGYLLGNSEFVYKQGIARFLEGTSTFSNIILFLMLGLLVFPSELPAFTKEGMLIALLLMLVARPAAVFLTTLFWDYSLKEKIFLCWGGIRGVVPIVLATYPAVAGVDHSNYFFNIVFFVVLVSALIQGSTLDLLAHRLDLLVGTKKTPPHSLELISTETTKCELLEFEVEKGSSLVGKRLEYIPLPKTTLVTAIVRHDDIVTPRGDTEIQEGDILFILTHYDDKERLLAVLE